MSDVVKLTKPQRAALLWCKEGKENFLFAPTQLQKPQERIMWQLKDLGLINFNRFGIATLTEEGAAIRAKLHAAPLPHAPEA